MRALKNFYKYGKNSQGLSVCYLPCNNNQNFIVDKSIHLSEFVCALKRIMLVILWWDGILVPACHHNIDGLTPWNSWF